MLFTISQTRTSFPPSFNSTRPSIFTTPNPNFCLIQQIPKKGSHKGSLFRSLINCTHTCESSFNPLKLNARNPHSSIYSLAIADTPVQTSNVAERLRCLVTEFKSLSEPIDRVKRLLHYASLLPPFDESGRVQANRVMGCTTQVWLEAKMESDGSMRFRVDSDSEITKGFCSCLIWLLDGAASEEVLEVKTEDLADVNVGLTSTARSRVNAWHNILVSMQNRTKALNEERASAPLAPLDLFLP